MKKPYDGYTFLAHLRCTVADRCEIFNKETPYDFEILQARTHLAWLYMAKYQVRKKPGIKFSELLGFGYGNDIDDDLYDRIVIKDLRGMLDVAGENRQQDARITIYLDYSYRLHLYFDEHYSTYWEDSIFDYYDTLRKKGVTSRQDSPDIEGQVVFLVENSYFLQHTQRVIKSAAKLRAEEQSLPTTDSDNFQ